MTINSQIAKSIEFYNEGVKYEKNKNFKLAEKYYLNAIKINPNFFQAHYNLANIKKNINELNEAIFHLKKTIENKPNFVNAYNNLGGVLKDLGELDQAEQNFKNAIKLNPEFKEAKINLESIIDLKRLTAIVKPSKQTNNKLNLISNSNTFKTFRIVENELIDELYRLKIKELDTEKNIYDARFGDGKFSNFKLFDNNSSIIQKIKSDLTNIMQEAVKSEIYIKESFFNILKAGSGTHIHNHISTFDRNFGYENQKFSLTYYLTIGDQEASEPGVLKLYDPEKEILPKEGLLLIFPAHQRHSAVYNGKKDRVMIGVNFYSLN